MELAAGSMKETKRQRQEATARFIAFMQQIGAEFRPSELYPWLIQTTLGPLQADIARDMDGIGVVCTKFVTVPDGLPQGDYPHLNSHTGKWNFHAATLGEAVGWFAGLLAERQTFTQEVMAL